MEKVNARIILNQSIGEFEERLQENEIELISTVPEEDIFITADNRYLWRVFENLMSNISKYAMPHTRAYIDLVDADGNISFIFRNISRDRLNISADELMERFVRGDSSRNKEGNGLGLSIASSLAKSMGGDMKITIDGDLFKASVLFTKQV
jgi:signal transduction histidine kinase